VQSPFYRFLSGWAFPAFLISLLLFGTVLLAVMAFIPAEGTALESFAREFRVWCYGLDPETGEMQWAYVVSMTTSPLMLVAFTAMIWWGELRRVVREAPRRLLAAVLPALAVVLALAMGIGALGPSSSSVTDDLPFPAESLRTSHEPPPFDLINQDGEEVSLEALRGRVVVVTGVYATCGTACPMILGQARRVTGGLTEAERRDVTVVAITLDPERDTPETMGRMAEAQGVEAPLFNLVSGEDATEVDALLDQMGFARERDPETGIIDHANLFLLIDRDGRIAYRFTLGEQQERWLTEALRLLVSEGRSDDRGDV